MSDKERAILNKRHERTRLLTSLKLDYKLKMSTFLVLFCKKTSSIKSVHMVEN